LYKIQCSKEAGIVPEKILGQACIFEDDPKQMQHYRTMVERSSYSLSPEGSGCSSTASDILAEAQNPDAHLFLIDIEQDEDPYAGIRLGEQVLRMKAEQYRSLTRDDHLKDHEKTKIVIWTRSVQKMKEATQHFSQIQDDLNKEWRAKNRRDLIDGIGGGSSETAIKLEVMMKNEDPF
jgi:hypothetical protein